MKAIVTFNCVSQGYTLYHAARTSMKLAAQRWGWRFLVVTKPLFDCSVWYQKFLLPSVLVNYERLLVLDGDIVIRPDCPCPDNYVINQKTAYVSVFQPHRSELALHNMQSENIASINKLWKSPNIIYPSTLMMNGGFQLYTPNNVRSPYEQAFEFARSQKFDGSSWNSDQGIITYMMMTGMLKNTQWLPEDFNFICSDFRHMTHWIMHAHCVGWKTKVRQMQNWYNECYETNDNL